MASGDVRRVRRDPMHLSNRTIQRNRKHLSHRKKTSRFVMAIGFNRDCARGTVVYFVKAASNQDLVETTSSSSSSKARKNHLRRKHRAHRRKRRSIQVQVVKVLVKRRLKVRMPTLAQMGQKRRVRIAVQLPLIRQLVRIARRPVIKRLPVVPPLTVLQQPAAHQRVRRHQRVLRRAAVAVTRLDIR